MKNLSTKYCFFLLLPVFLYTQTNTVKHTDVNILFIHDCRNAEENVFLEQFRRDLPAAGSTTIATPDQLKDTAVNAADYNCVIIYSEIRAFSLQHSVEKWLEQNNRLHNKKIFILITAKDIKFAKKSLPDLKKNIQRNGGKITDAVTAATQKINDRQRRELVKKFLKKISSYLKKIK
ncbi:MAG TPA: hypothetical protein VKS21_01545 [Spirochaetota bacterium]|nr:hypothetical protein [Spirochaetota bacterium]